MANALKEERNSSKDLPIDTQTTQENMFASCSCLLFFPALAPSCKFVQDLYVWNPCGMRHISRWSSNLDGSHAPVHTKMCTHTHNILSPVLSEHPVNQLCTAMHDKGMQHFDKDEPQQSGEPAFQPEPATVINQPWLFTAWLKEI